MKTIPIIEWKSNDQNGKVNESTLVMLNALISLARPEDIPRGLEQFHLYQRLSIAFEKASVSKKLVLEDNDYSLLKRIVEKNVPAQWALNKNIASAIDSVLKAGA